ncbi:flagellar basal-body rod protein FlgG [Buchnera aphidicola (Kurisakia onigurumii)]|uniref:flagellar basal-body rod protein FlgG n=1 Tax=Buchnera aphidicola TaxID=9 RepID=UPI0031B6A6DC
MFPSLWIAKTGLDAQQMNMDIISNNLANVSTNGFKKSRPIFEDLIYQNLRDSGSNSSKNTVIPVGLQIGTGVRPLSTEKIFTQGNLLKTDSNKDISINGKGFFQVLLPEGKIAYTRDGSFQINNKGQFVNNNGFVIHSSGGIFIPENATSINIGKDGIITTKFQGSHQNLNSGQLNIVSFMNESGLENLGGNLYQETDASGPAIENIPGTNGLGSLYQGYTETSNVNVAEELINMIRTQRSYEINSKAINISDQMLQKLTQL